MTKKENIKIRSKLISFLDECNRIKCLDTLEETYRTKYLILFQNISTFCKKLEDEYYECN